MAVLVIINVIARNFFKSLFFVEEVSMLLSILCTFTGTSYAVRKNLHIKMTAIFDHLSLRLQKTLILTMSFLSFGAMWVMCYFSASYVYKVRNMEVRLPALNILFWMFLVIVPLGFFMAGVVYFSIFIKNMYSKQVWLSLDEEQKLGQDNP